LRRELPGGYELDDDPGRVDLDAVHEFISEHSYWGLGRARELLQGAISGSTRVVGLYRGDRQVGFARAISDGAIVAYLADVYVLPAHRGHGLGIELVREILDGGPGWKVRWILHTADAQGLYAKLGFTEDEPPYALMERPRGVARAGGAGGPPRQ
jgi:GNAT superfamily N-acetyltransferase